MLFGSHLLYCGPPLKIRKEGQAMKDKVTKTTFIKGLIFNSVRETEEEEEGSQPSWAAHPISETLSSCAT